MFGVCILTRWPDDCTFFPVVIFSSDSWCLYFDMTDSYLRGPDNCAFFPVVIFPVIVGVWILTRQTPSVGMFGGSMSSDCFGRLLNQITTGKKGAVVWPLVWMFGGFHELQSFIKLRPEKKVQSYGHQLECLGGYMSSDCWSNYDRKKGTVIWPLVGMFGWFHCYQVVVGRKNIYPAKPTSTHPYCFFTISVRLLLLFYNKCE